MRRQSLVSLIISLVSFLIVFTAIAQEDMVVVAGDSFVKQRRPPAVFRHDEHNEIAQIEDCNECHHVYENGEKLDDESSEDQRCADCHAEKSSDGQPGLRKAFHLNCKGCHQTKRMGPLMCGECHLKQPL